LENSDNTHERLLASHPHIGIAYKLFDRFFGNIRWELDGSVAEQLGVSRNTLQSRLAQKFSELTLPAYIQCVQEHVVDGQAPRFDIGSHPELSGFLFDTESGRIRVSFGTVIRFLAEHIKYSAIAIWFSVFSTRDKACQSKGPVVLALGIARESIYRNSSDHDFATYCESGPLLPLRIAQRLIVEFPERLMSVDDRIVYRKRPLVSLLETASFPLRIKIRLAIAQIRVLLLFLFLTIKRSPLVCLAKDLAWHEPILFSMEWSNTSDLFFTNSNYLEQPLWSRANRRKRFQVHMAWYSQNIVPVTFKSDSIKSDNPQFRHLCVDAHWVWTDDFGQYLKNLGAAGQLNVIGPMLWYFPDSTGLPLSTADDSIALACFDITPVTKLVERDLGLLGNYYCTENAMAFLLGIAKLAEVMRAEFGVPTRILLKHKRASGTTHDLEYFKLIEKLKMDGVPIELLKHDTNIYSIVDACDLTVVMPFSSPAYVAAMRGIPAIFFDPTDSITSRIDPMNHLHFASGLTELLRIASQEIRSTRTITGTSIST
jgi:hypothetical protein